MTARRDVRAFIAALLLYAVFYSAVFLKSLLSGEYIAPSDALDFGVASYLSSPSLWTQGLYSGYPIAADPQSLIWYPVLQLFRILGVGWNAFMVAPFVLASATCFLLVRRLTRSNIAATFSGFVFGFSGPMLGNLGHFNQLHATAWMPLVLYGLQLTREGLYRTGTAIAAIAFAMVWLAGHPQIAVYTAYLSAALLAGGLFIDRPPKASVVKRVSWSAVAMGLGTGLAAVMIIPMLELSELGHRSSSNWELYTSKALPPWQLLTLVFPSSFGFWADNDLSVPYFGDGSPGENFTYIGLLPLVLALAGPFVLKTFRRESRLWIGIALVATLLCLGAATPLGAIFYYVPGYARFRVPSRHLFVVALCLAVGAGFGMAELSRRRNSGYAIASALVVIMAIGASVFAVLAWHTPAVWTLVTENHTYLKMILLPLVPAAVFIACVLTPRQFINHAPRPLAFGLLLIAAQLVDLGVVHYRVPGSRYEYNDVVPAEIAPHPRIAVLRQELNRTGERVLAVDGTHNQFLLPNLTRPWNIAAAGGSGPLGIGRYVDLLRMGGPGDVPPDTLSAADQTVDLFAIRYVLVPTDSPQANDLKQQTDRWTEIERLRYYDDDPSSHYTLFRNARAQPRAWCARVVVQASPEMTLTAIRSSRLPDGRAFDPAKIALVETGVLPHWNGSDVPDETPEVTIRLGPESEYVVNSRTPCLLLLSEVHYPWWRASVDDAPANIARVDYAMMGVPVPPGSHIVRVWLRPLSLWAGGAVSGACLLAWIVVAVAARTDRKAPYP
jgi:hypothetical protein